MFKYSEELRLRAIKYFEWRCKKPITHEQADYYLDQLAKLMLVFADIEADRRKDSSKKILGE